MCFFIMGLEGLICPYCGLVICNILYLSAGVKENGLQLLKFNLIKHSDRLHLRYI